MTHPRRLDIVKTTAPTACIRANNKTGISNHTCSSALQNERVLPAASSKGGTQVLNDLSIGTKTDTDAP